MNEAQTVITQATAWKTEFDEAKQRFQKTDEVGRSILQNFQNRDTWAEFLKAIDLCLPRTEGERPKDIAQREEVKIDAFECRWEPKLEDWYKTVHQYYEADEGNKPPPDPNAQPMDPNAQPMDPNAQPMDPNAQPALDANGNPIAAPAQTVQGGPTGPGWVFQITAHHYRNIRTDPQNQGVQYLRRTLLANLKKDEIALPSVDGKPARSFPVKKLGIAWPVLVGAPSIDWNFQVAVEDEEADPNAQPMGGGMPAAGGPVKMHTQPRYDFKLQFCWQPFPPAQPKPAVPLDNMAGQ
jgi:hypothetical protein